MSNTNQFTDNNILDVINNINKQVSFIKSIYKVHSDDSNITIPEDVVLNDIQNFIEDVVQAIETSENIKNEEIKKTENNAYKFVSTVEDNDTLLISEKQGRIFLPYTVNELKEYIKEYPEEYKSLSDVVNQEYIVSIDRYKNETISRFKEMYCLMRDIEMKSIIESFKKAVEVMFNSSINPAVIAACKSKEQVNNYIRCLERNDLDSFKDFKIVFDVPPVNTVTNYEYDWEEKTIRNTNNRRRGKHY